MRSACTQGAARGGILCGNLRRGGIRDDAAAIFASARAHLNDCLLYTLTLPTTPYV